MNAPPSRHPPRLQRRLLVVGVSAAAGLALSACERSSDPARPAATTPRQPPPDYDSDSSPGRR